MIGTARKRRPLTVDPRIDPRRRHIGTWAYLANRVSALGLTAYLFIHLLVLGKLAQGPAAYDSFVALAKNPVLVAGELLVVVAGLFHGLNGLRLVVTSFGIGVPYQKQMLYGVGVIVAVAAAVFALRMFGGA